VIKEGLAGRVGHRSENSPQIDLSSESTEHLPEMERLDEPVAALMRKAAWISQFSRLSCQHVICQEIGHTFGLDHQDESGISLNTCMDYYHNTSASDTKSTHPNQHDYDELATIYQHLDSFSTVGAASAGFLPDAVPSFAPATRLNDSTYVDDLGGGRKLVTYVIWVR
jgi:hypothetical protein